MGFESCFKYRRRSERSFACFIYCREFFLSILCPPGTDSFTFFSKFSPNKTRRFPRPVNQPSAADNNDVKFVSLWYHPRRQQDVIVSRIYPPTCRLRCVQLGHTFTCGQSLKTQLSRGWGVTVYVFDVTHRACTLLFILFLCQFVSLWPFQLYFFPYILLTVLCFLTLFFPSYTCLICAFDYIFLYESLPSPDIIRSGWLGSKLQLTY